MLQVTDRRYMRMKVLKPLAFTCESGTHDGTLQDISLCGALILSPATIETGTRVQLDFKLPTDPDPIRVHGKVVRLLSPGNPLGTGFGVDFTVVGINHREAIDHYVRSTFRYFRSLQFELSKFDVDWTTVRELVQHTYLQAQSYSTDALRNLVAIELESFRLRKVVSVDSTG